MEIRIRVRSSSDGRRKYTVTKRKGRGWACSCKGWIFHHKDCRHIRQVKAA